MPGAPAAPISLAMSTTESHTANEQLSPATSVEVLMENVSRLVGERQSLRATGAGRTTLERNRAAIARLQWQLSHALIARYAASV